MQLQNDIKINEYSVIPHKITEKKLKEKKLLLTLSLFQDEMEMAITDASDNSVYTSCSYISNQAKFTQNEQIFFLNDFIHRYHLHQYDFQKIYIILSTPHFTLCPSEFYISEKKELLLNYVHPIQMEELAFADSFESVKILYTIDKSIHQNLLQVFPSAHIVHSATAMMNIFFYHPLLVHSKIWIHIHPNYIEVMAKDNRQLLMYNTFDIQTSVDILYYILFCIQQLNYSYKETDVFLSGNISAQHTVLRLLSKYVHSVQIVHHHPKLHILPVESLLISHHHFITLNYHLCVSFQANTKAEK